jgi:hypothetical protein
MTENKVLKCYMESTYNVIFMLCKLYLPSIWDSFVRIQMAIFYLCVIWNHVQCGSCKLCKFLPCLISFGTYFKLLHKIPKGTSMCMMTILWQLMTMHMKLVRAQSSNVHIDEENGKYSKVDSCCSTIDWFQFFFFGKDNNKPNLTSHWHSQVKLIGKMLTRVSPTFHWVWTHDLFWGPKMLHQWAIIPRVNIGYMYHVFMGN